MDMVGWLVAALEAHGVGFLSPCPPLIMELLLVFFGHWVAGGLSFSIRLTSAATQDKVARMKWTHEGHQMTVVDKERQSLILSLTRI